VASSSLLVKTGPWQLSVGGGVGWDVVSSSLWMASGTNDFRGGCKRFDSAFVPVNANEASVEHLASFAVIVPKDFNAINTFSIFTVHLVNAPGFRELLAPFHDDSNISRAEDPLGSKAM